MLLKEQRGDLKWQHGKWYYHTDWETGDRVRPFAFYFVGRKPDIAELKSRRRVRRLIRLLWAPGRDGWGDRHRHEVMRRALGELGDRRAIRPLIRFMTYSPDTFAFPRSSNSRVTDALARFGRLAEKRLVKTLRHSEPAGVGCNAVRTLVKIGGASVVSALIRELNDSNSYVHYAAAEALAELGDPRAVEPLVRFLIEYLQGPYPWQAKNIAQALGMLAKRAGSQAVGPLAVAPLIEFMERGDCALFSGAAADALGEIGDVRAIPSRLKAFIRGGKNGASVQRDLHGRLARLSLILLWPILARNRRPCQNWRAGDCTPHVRHHARKRRSS